MDFSCRKNINMDTQQETIAQNREMIGEDQFGFRKGRGTTESIGIPKLFEAEATKIMGAERESQ